MYPDHPPKSGNSPHSTLLWLLCLLFLLPCQLFAQPSLLFKRYTVQDGLSHNYVRKVIQDKDGFIWIATEEGLNKFNAYTFQVYKNVPGDTTSLSNHSIMTLAEDSDHNLWVGTWGGGIFIYNRKLDNFSRLRHIEGNRNSLASNYIYAIYRDSKGRMWVGTNEKGLDLVNLQTKTYTHYFHDPKNPNSLSHNRVISLVEDKAGNLWIGTIGGGVNYFNPQTGTFRHYLHDEGNKQSVSSNNVYCLLYDHYHRLWVGTWDKGLNLMRENADGFVHFKNDPSVANSLSNNEIWAMTENQEGQVWIGTDNGLNLYHEATGTFTIYRNEPFDAKSLAAHSVKSLYVDKQNRLWVGSVNNGVCLADKSMVQMGHYYQKADNSSISNNDVTAFLQIQEKKLLIGTDGGGLNLLDRTTGHFTYYQHDYKNPKSIGSDKIKVLHLDRKKRIWIGFWGGGLDYFDQASNSFTHFKQAESDAEGQNTDNVTALAEDQDGSLWLATFGGGLNKFDPETRTFQSYRQDNSPHSLSDKYIWAVLVDRKNNVWAGTSNGKLDRFDRKTKQFIHVPLQKPEEDGYAVQIIFEDSKGRIWVGLEGGGLKLLDKNGLTCQKTFNTKTGLPVNNINSIAETPDGHLWLSTNQGIVRFDPQSGRCKSFTISDGAQGLHFNRNASIRLTSGELAFGGNNGFNLFHPDSLKDVSIQAPIVLTDFQIFNKPVRIGTKDSPLQAQLNQTDAITLSYQQSVFSIEYAGLNYTSPEKIRYKYRLKGFVDESWQEVGTTRKVTYTNLQPGEYTFEVTTLQDNQAKNPVRQLSITITPPWWKTTWARLLGLLLIVSVLGSIYYLRSRNILQQNKKLEYEVAQRTAELQRVNVALKDSNQLIQEQKEEIQSQAEELLESNMEIKLANQQLEERVEMRTSDLKKTNQELDNFVYRVSHDIRAPLSSVLGLVELIKTEQDEAQLKEYLQLVTKSVNKLDGFVRDILDYSRNSRMTIHQEEIHFPSLLTAIHEELQYMENAGRINFESELSIAAPHHNDVRRLHIIFRNLFSNAIKYQHLRIDNPHVKIRIATDGQGASIVMQDNGIGIETRQLSKVFDMFYRGSELSTGSGIGLYIVKEAVEKLSGTIHIESALGEGTVFTIWLPTIHSDHSED